MSIVNRARTALLSNVNAILSRLEESGGNISGLLDQLHQELLKAKRELISVLGEEKRLRERAGILQRDAEQWKSRAELAVRQGDDSLARDALVQQRRLLGESERDARAAEEHGVFAESLRTDLKQMEEKHLALSSRKSTIGTSIDRSRSGGGVESLGATPGQNPFDELRRVEQMVEDSEISADAQKEVEAVLSPGVPSDPAVPKRRVRVE